NPSRHAARRSPGRAADEVRAPGQPQDCESGRPHRSAIAHLAGGSGHRLSIGAVRPAEQTANLLPAAQVFQAQLTRIGIDLQLEVLDWPAYIKRRRALDFTNTNTNFFPKVDPDDAYYRYFHSKGGANELSGGYANPAADKLLEEGEATVDAGKRAEAYKRLVQLLDDEVPVVTTGLGDAAAGWRTPVKGFEPH